jgi:putative transposase
MAEYRKGSHTIYDIQYHFVWVTKYRYHVLTGEVAERARELILQSCISRDIKIVKGHVSKDHIHVMVSCPPRLSPSKIMQYLKGRSSRLLQEEFPHLKKRYWGRHLWARGYFCATVGRVTEDQIKAYIEKHEQEPPEDAFRIE